MSCICANQDAMAVHCYLLQKAGSATPSYNPCSYNSPLNVTQQRSHLHLHADRVSVVTSANNEGMNVVLLFYGENIYLSLCLI
jgi:hypothetical protein